jgi:hypothetical protein
MNLLILVTENIVIINDLITIFHFLFSYVQTQKKHNKPNSSSLDGMNIGIVKSRPT